MKIYVIASNEPRRRYKFIADPLSEAGNEVNIIRTRPVWSFLLDLLRLATRSKGHVDAVIIMGLGLNNFLVVCLCLVRGCPVLARLGGDQVRARRSVANVLLDKKRYVAWTKALIKLLLDRVVLSAVDGVIIVNSALSSCVRKYNKRAELIVCPQFCEVEPITKYDNGSASFVLLTVTNLRYYEKAVGVIWLIKELARSVRKGNRPTYFYVIGDGLHLADVKQYLESVKIPDAFKVRLVGFDTNVNYWYSKADAFVYQSYFDGTPNVILEAKRHGLPVLANDCEEFRSLIANNRSGFLYRDGAEFRKRVGQIRGSQRLRKELGTHALSEHWEQYSKWAISLRLHNELTLLLRPEEI